MHRKHIETISGLRALAVLSVVIFHANSAWLPGGFVGVDIFFVISGFVVAHSVLGGAYPDFASYFQSFYRRRFQRILPALFAYIVVAVVLSVLFVPRSQETRYMEISGASAVVGMSNFFLWLRSGDYFSAGSELNLFTHTWSLAVEEQYYFLFPYFSYALLVSQGNFRKRRVAIASVVIASLTSLAFCAWSTKKNPILAFYLLPARFWELGIGFLLRVTFSERVSERFARLGPEVLTSTGLLALLALIFSLAKTDSFSFPYPGAVVPCFATAVLIAVTWVLPGNRIDRLLSHPQVTFFGKISYSLYLWHWLVFVLMRWTVGVETQKLQLLGVSISILLGWLSYRYIEVIFHNKQTRGGSPTGAFFLRYGVVASGVAMICFLAYLVKPSIGLAKSNNLAIWDPYAAPPLSSACKVSKHVADLADGLELTFPSSCRMEGLPRLIVVGDSHAGAYQRTIWRMAGEGRVEPHLLTLGGCRFVVVTKVPSVAGCDEFRAAAIKRLQELARPGDVIFLAGLQTPRYSSEGGNDVSVVLDHTAELKSREQLVALQKISGASLLIEGAKPVMPAPLYRCADWFNRQNPVCRLNDSIAPAQNWVRLGLVQPALWRVVEGLPGVSIWNPSDVLCWKNQCPAYENGSPLYFDTDHLSAYGNDFLLQSFERTVYARLGSAAG